MFSYLEYWEQRPIPVQILGSQVQSLRYSQPGHTEMLRSIPITGVSKKGKGPIQRWVSVVRRANWIQFQTSNPGPLIQYET